MFGIQRDCKVPTDPMSKIFWKHMTKKQPMLESNFLILYKYGSIIIVTILCLFSYKYVEENHKVDIYG